MFDFSRTNRLLKSRDFEATMNSGTKVVSPHLVVIANRSSLAAGRLGLVVSRKVGSSVTRNRIKRNLRECFRHIKDQYPGLDVVVIARHSCGNVTGSSLCQTLERMLISLTGKLQPSASS